MADADDFDVEELRRLMRGEPSNAGCRPEAKPAATARKVVGKKAGSTPKKPAARRKPAGR